MFLRQQLLTNEEKCNKDAYCNERIGLPTQFILGPHMHGIATIRCRNYRFLSQILDILPPGKLV